MSDNDFPVQLAGALAGVLARGDHSLGALVAGLNQSEVRPKDGGSWTDEILTSEFRRLGNTPVKPDYAYASAAALGDGPRGIERGALRRSPEEREQRLVRFGLRNHWYAVAASVDVAEKPFGVTRLGEKIVLWRDSAGKVRAVEDRCPHRAVALSIGEVRDDHIRCAYHGVEVDAQGVVARVPGLPGCGLEGRKLIQSYPVVEHYGAIWAYFGDEQEPPALELPFELTDAEWSSGIHFDVWPCNYRYIYDNLLDPMHGIVLHGQTFTQSEGANQDTVRVKDTPAGVEVSRKGQRGVNFDWCEYVDTGSAYFRVEIPLPPAAGPGGTMHISFFATPVDEHNTYVTVFRSRKASGWERDLWHFLYNNRLVKLFDAVLAQDWMVANAMPKGEVIENLYQHDIGLVRLRRLLDTKAKEQSYELGLGDY